MKIRIEYLLFIPIVGFIIWLLYRGKTGVSSVFVNDYTMKDSGNGEKGISLERYKYLADVCFTAMETPGTDIKSLDYVYSEIKDVPNGFNNLSSAFGKRHYFWMGSAGGNWFLETFVGDALNLPSWLEKELSGVDLDKWRSLM